MARCAASHCCGPLVALGLDRVEKWHWPGLAGAFPSSALCLLLIGPGGSRSLRARLRRTRAVMNMVETEQDQMWVFSWTGSRPWGPGFAAAAVRLGAPLWLERIWHNA